MTTLSLNYYFYILRILESMGVNRSEITHMLPFKPGAEPKPHARLDIAALDELFTYAEERLANPHIGVHVSHNFRITNYGYAGEIFAICENLLQALSLAQKYGPLAHTFGQLKIDKGSDFEGDMSKIIFIPSYPESKHKHITECIVTNYFGTINWLIWDFAENIEKVTFQHEPTLPISGYANVLSCDLEFGSTENSLIFPSSLLERPLRTSNPVKLAGLQKKLNGILAGFNQQTDLIDRTAHIMHKMMPSHQPSIAAVARELGLSERTFKRYLRIENAKFQDLLNQVKMELCSSYIKEGLPFTQIAQLLWYHDQSSFTRAYKKWHGITPKQHKKQMNQ